MAFLRLFGRCQCFLNPAFEVLQIIPISAGGICERGQLRFYFGLDGCQVRAQLSRVRRRNSIDNGLEAPRVTEDLVGIQMSADHCGARWQGQQVFHHFSRASGIRTAVGRAEDKGR